MALLISALLALIALAGLAWNAFSGGGLQGLLTVDGLFSSLIFASMFAIFAFNSLTELRALRLRRKAQAASAASATAAKTAGAGAAEEQASPELVWLDRARPVIERGVKSSESRLAPAENVDGLTRGSILVKQGAPLPAGIAGQTRTDLGEWNLLDNDAAARLSRASSESRLQLFYFVGPVEKSAFGFNRKQAVRKTLARALETVNAHGRNALEITRLTTHSFLGLHYAELTVRMRHLQHTPFGFETQPAGGSNGSSAAGTGMMPASPEQELSTEDIGHAA